MSNIIGRPPFYSTPEELQIKIQKYLDNLPTIDKYTSDGIKYKVPCPTITGLTLFLGFCDRQSFYDYEQNKPEFTCTIKSARTFIEKHYEEMLQHGNQTGAIFALKNFGWIDKIETDNKNNNVNMSYSEYKEQLAAEREKAIRDKSNAE